MVMFGEMQELPVKSKPGKMCVRSYKWHITGPYCEQGWNRGGPGQSPSNLRGIGTHHSQNIETVLRPNPVAEPDAQIFSKPGNTVACCGSLDAVSMDRHRG